MHQGPVWRKPVLHRPRRVTPEKAPRKSAAERQSACESAAGYAGLEHERQEPVNHRAMTITPKTSTTIP